MDKTTRDEPMETGESISLPVLIAIGLVILSLVILFIIGRRKIKRTDILLAGLCDSGKTLLY